MRRWMWFVLTAVGVVALTVLPALGQEECPASLPFVQGGWARLTNEIPNNLRGEPALAGARIGTIPAGDIIRVLGGPRCADGYVWWEVVYIDQPGWTAAGPQETDDMWWEPLDGQDSPTPEEGDSVCARPPDDYNRIDVNAYSTLNLRTLAMLDHAQVLYSAAGGVIDIRRAVMQGSYNQGGVAASFGTHDGGGAVDLSVRDLQTRMVLEREIDPLLLALRQAGFAAWLRAENQLNPGSPIHIHAIAVGDADLSEAAMMQVEGEYGYFNGYNGLPPGWGGPALDDLPVVMCEWMRELGYEDRTEAAY